jgi:hypothetical protein
VGHARHILFARRAALAGLWVDGLNATTIGSEKRGAFVQVQIKGRFARSKLEIARHRGHGPVNEVGWNLHYLGGAIYLRTVLRKEGKRLLGREPHTNPF